jgi:hypothetical protein
MDRAEPGVVRDLLSLSGNFASTEYRRATLQGVPLLNFIRRVGGLIKRLNKPKKRLTKAFERAYCSPTYTGLIGK